MGGGTQITNYSVPAIPAASTTLPQRTISDFTNAFMSSIDGVSSGNRLSLAICSLSAGVASTFLISVCSLATTAGGVFAGATTMNQPATSKPGTPASLIGGMSGNAASRALVETPSARTLPAWIMPAAGGTSQNISSMWPATTSLSAGTLPL